MTVATRLPTPIAARWLRLQATVDTLIEQEQDAAERGDTRRARTLRAALNRAEAQLRAVEAELRRVAQL